MAPWSGTFLSAAFLAPPPFWSTLPGLLVQWRDAGLLDRGIARWLDLRPDLVSYDAVMAGPPSSETHWEGGIATLLDHVSRETLTQPRFPVEWVHGQGELSVDFMVNPDDSVGVYLNAPYSDVYQLQPLETGQSNIDRFVDAACALFSPTVFVVGKIDEEAQLPGLTEVRSLPDDWAFYGAGVSQHLFPLLSAFSAKADIRRINEVGLFVRWTRWDERPLCPPEWRTTLRQAQTAAGADSGTLHRY